MREMCGAKLVVIILVILGFFTIEAMGQEKEFPIKPVNVYAGFSPGGGATHTATIVCEGMKKYLKQPVLLNYKPGAGQAVAAEFIANSPPDGYTLLYPYVGDLILKVIKDGHMLKFSLENFDSLGAGPCISYGLVVNAESPWKNIEDVVAAARKSPGKLNISSSGFSTTTHLIGELFAMKNGITLNHVPFTGGGPSITALLGKHVDISVATVSTLAGHTKPGGGLRALLVFDAKRIADLPDVPTASEKGMDIVSDVWYAIMAPKGLPKTVRATLIEAFKKAIEDPQTISAMGNVPGTFCNYLTPEETNKKIQKESKIYQDTLKKM